MKKTLLKNRPALWFLNENYNSKTAQALRLRYQNPEMLVEDIAAKIGSTPNAVNVALSTARAKGMQIPKVQRQYYSSTGFFNRGKRTKFSLALALRHYFPKMSVEGIAKLLNVSVSEVQSFFRIAERKGYPVIPLKSKSKPQTVLNSQKALALRLRWKRPDLTNAEIDKRLGFSHRRAEKIFKKALMHGYPLPDLNAEIQKLKALKKNIAGMKSVFPRKRKGIARLIDLIDDRIEKLEKRKLDKRWLRQVRVARKLEEKN